MKNLKRSQFGRSLIELMIAIGLGTVITLAISGLFVANNFANKAVDHRARMEEDARLTLNMIAYHLRMAGYGDLISADPDLRKPNKTQFDAAGISDIEALTGCSSGFADPKTGTTCNAPASSPTSDAFAVRYIVSPVNANVTAGPGPLPTDCLGQGVLGTPAVVENRFYVAKNAKTGRNELYCAGNGGAVFGSSVFANGGQPLAENVVEMKLEYLVNKKIPWDQTSPDSFLELTADKLNNPAANALQTYQPNKDPGMDQINKITPWMQVYAVKVCLLMQSADDGVATSKQSYTDCSGATKAATDYRLYRVFSTTVALRARTLGV